MTTVNIVLDMAPLSRCEIGDADGDGRIMVNEVVTAVRYGLEGCPAEPRVCGGITDLQCDTAEICDLEDPTCQGADLAGVCVPRPAACPEIYEPVCGCDSITYSNDCFRLSAGATLAHEGTCG